MDIAITAREVSGRLGKIFKVNVLLDTKTTKTIRPGMSARVEIITALVEQANSIEIASIKEDDLGKFVWIIKEDKAVRQMVELGESDDEFIEIFNITDEQQQIISGPSRAIELLKEQDLVSVIESKNQDQESNNESD